MNEFEKYIDKVVENISYDNNEKQDTKEELIDHLNLLKEEYKRKGYSDDEAAKFAIRDFGDSKHINGELREANCPLSKNSKIIFKILFGIYLFIVAFCLLSPWRKGAYIIRISKEYISTWSLYINLVPFKTILNYVIGFNHYNLDIIIKNLLGNVVLFIPFGFLLPIVLNRGKNIKNNILVTAAAGAGIELLQLIFSLGVCDIDDVILYVLGSIIGLGCYKLLLAIVRLIKKQPAIQ